MTSEEQPDSSDPAARRSLIWNAVALLFGWSSFFYWWSVVLGRTESAIVVHLLKNLLILISVIVAFSLVWIVHNLRLARRGQRNRETRYNPGVLDRDRLDREVVLGNVDVLRDASVVVVHTTERQKLYREFDPESADR